MIGENDRIPEWERQGAQVPPDGAVAARGGELVSFEGHARERRREVIAKLWNTQHRFTTELYAAVGLPSSEYQRNIVRKMNEQLEIFTRLVAEAGQISEDEWDSFAQEQHR